MDMRARKQRELKDLILANKEWRRKWDILKLRLSKGWDRQRKLEQEIGKISSRGCPALKKRLRGKYSTLYFCLLRDSIYSMAQFRELYCSKCRFRKRRDFAVRVIAKRIEMKDTYGQ